MRQKIFYLIIYLFIFSSTVPSYGLIYNESFDSDPFLSDWTTNNSGRYYWDSSNKWLHTENYTNSGDWAMKSIEYNGESFILSFDIQPTERNSGDVNFGLFGATKVSNSNTSNEERLYTLVGGYQEQIYIQGYNSNGDSINSGPGNDLMAPYEWHHIEIAYDSVDKDLELHVACNGVSVLDWETTMSYGFSDSLDFLGVSMVGSWVTSDRYEAANIDNVFFSNEITPVPEPATLLLLGSGIASLSVVRRKKIRK